MCFLENELSKENAKQSLHWAPQMFCLSFSMRFVKEARSSRTVLFKRRGPEILVKRGLWELSGIHRQTLQVLNGKNSIPTQSPGRCSVKTHLPGGGKTDDLGFCCIM